MKEFDLVIFGATGLTGGQTAAYVNRLAKDEGISWAIAGRNESKLEELVANFSLEPDGIVVADALDETSVQAMVTSSQVTNLLRTLLVRWVLSSRRMMIVSRSEREY